MDQSEIVHCVKRFITQNSTRSAEFIFKMCQLCIMRLWAKCTQKKRLCCEWDQCISECLYFSVERALNSIYSKQKHLIIITRMQSLWSTIYHSNSTTLILFSTILSIQTKWILMFFSFLSIYRFVYKMHLIELQQLQLFLFWKFQFWYVYCTKRVLIRKFKCPYVGRWHDGIESNHWITSDNSFEWIFGSFEHN